MNTKTIDAVKLKRRLQKLAERKLAGLSAAEQIEFLRKKFGRGAVKKKSSTWRAHRASQ